MECTLSTIHPAQSLYRRHCCTTLTPSCHAQLRTAENAWERLGKTGKDWEARKRDYETKKEAGIARNIPSSRSPVVPSSRSPLKNTAILRRSQSFSGVPSKSRASVSRASVNLAPRSNLSRSHSERPHSERPNERTEVFVRSVIRRSRHSLFPPFSPPPSFGRWH